MSLYMRSPSGRTWRVAAQDSAGRTTTKADAERIAADLGFTLIEEAAEPAPDRSWVTTERVAESFRR